MMQDLEISRGFKFKQEGERGDAQSGRMKKHAVGGVKQLLESDVDRMVEKVTSLCPEHPHPLHSVTEEAAKAHQKAVERAKAAAEKADQKQKAADALQKAKGAAVKAGAVTSILRKALQKEDVAEAKPTSPGASPAPSPGRETASAKVNVKPTSPGASPAPSPGRETASAKVNAAASSSPRRDLTGEWRIRVYLLGGIGLAHETDKSTTTMTCHCELVDKPDGSFSRSILRETAIGKTEDHKNTGEFSGVVAKDDLEFAIAEPEEDNEEEEGILGVALLKAEKFLPNGFEGKLNLLDEEQVVMDGAFLLVKVEVLGRS
jgi:hypothetical protein